MNERDLLLEQLQSKETRTKAYSRLVKEGWLQDGRMAGASFVGLDFALDCLSFNRANLPLADFSDCQLLEISFDGTNLNGAQFGRASIQYSFWVCEAKGAILDRSDCQHAFLSHNFQDASCQFTNLSYAALSGDWRNASLRYANMQHTVLYKCNLQGTDFTGADVVGLEFRKEPIDFDTTTILPDGTPYIRDTDWERFINPAHPEFWRSTDPQSPAYLPVCERA